MRDAEAAEDAGAFAWTAGLVLILGLHLGAGGLWLWQRAGAAAEAPPAAVALIELAPLAAAPTPENEMPPGPRQMLTRPHPPVAPIAPPDPLPPAAASPALEIAVPVPPKPVLRPPQKPQPVAERKPPAPAPPDPRPPAPATTAPPQAAAAAVQASAPRADAAAPPSDALPNWQGLLLGRLERFKRYPREAQFRRQQGVALLAFTLDRQGKVLAARIAQSSGVAVLDEETLALLHRAEPLPPPPPEVPGEAIELTVPVQFFLK